MSRRSTREKKTVPKYVDEYESEAKVTQQHDDINNTNDVLATSASSSAPKSSKKRKGNNSSNSNNDASKKKRKPARKPKKSNIKKIPNKSKKVETESCDEASASEASSSSDLEDAPSSPLSTSSSSSLPSSSSPCFNIHQKVLAKDTSTPLLYPATIRKIIYAPKSLKVNIYLLESSDVDLDVDQVPTDEHGHSQSVYCWHYFVHYLGWNVKWDRWVNQHQLYEDNPDGRILAKRLKDESACLKKRKGKSGPSQKKVLEVMQKIVRLENELRAKQQRGESIEGNGDVDGDKDSDAGGDGDDAMKIKSSSSRSSSRKDKDANPDETTNTTKAKTKKQIKKEQDTLKFMLKEVALRKQDLTSKGAAGSSGSGMGIMPSFASSNPLNLPFPLKKILVDDWEVITKCDMLHTVPTREGFSVVDALQDYYRAKVGTPIITHDKEKMQMQTQTGDDTQVERESEATSGEEGTVTGGDNRESESVVEDTCTEKMNTEGEEVVNGDLAKSNLKTTGGEHMEIEVNEHNAGNVPDAAPNPDPDAEADINSGADASLEQKEWKEMIDGICLYFDQALPKRLLFRHEIPQKFVVEQNHSRRYCQIYPCEFLIRMCTLLPESLEEHANGNASGSGGIGEEEKTKILFKIGDLLRFLNRHRDKYFLQRYRKATGEEKAKMARFQKRLGLMEVDALETKMKDLKGKEVNDNLNGNTGSENENGMREGIDNKDGEHNLHCSKGEESAGSRASGRKCKAKPSKRRRVA